VLCDVPCQREAAKARHRAAADACAATAHALLKRHSLNSTMFACRYLQLMHMLQQHMRCSYDTVFQLHTVCLPCLQDFSLMLLGGSMEQLCLCCNSTQ
jgi:hypothetical protein